MRTIFVVDDSPTNLTVAKDALDGIYMTYALQSAAALFKLAAKITPDLILLDIDMPEMNGFEAVTKLKHDNKLRGIPVIFITALDTTEDEEKGLRLGAVDYITKPFHAPIMLARVKTHLQMADYIREIESFSETDTLTGLANRRSFDKRLNMEWSRAMREKEPLSLLMIDADKFKSYNDTYGHMQGDTLLRTMGDIFSKAVKRAGDMVARWGGEEFSVLLPNTGLDAAVRIAEHMRTEIADTVIPQPNGQPTRTTISIGVNCEIPTVDSVVDDFLIKADKRLYAAKEAGRNRVCSEDKDGAA
ncbi:MAG: diguanylate cyclase [Chitinispirillales bacterium]|jgi:diguanylate cyclase (GGDEF)-like protein|nr:diguanylate cyclase [Chitinispirillales bacterium]